MVFPGGCFGVNMCELSVYSHWILTHPQVTVSQVTACWGPGPALAVKRSGCGSSMPAGDGGTRRWGKSNQIHTSFARIISNHQYHGVGIIFDSLMVQVRALAVCNCNMVCRWV